MISLSAADPVYCTTFCRAADEQDQCTGVGTTCNSAGPLKTQMTHSLLQAGERTLRAEFLDMRSGNAVLNHAFIGQRSCKLMAGQMGDGHA